MKESSYETGLGRAGSENGQRGSGSGRACRSGVEGLRETAGRAAGFQPSVEEARRTGRVHFPSSGGDTSQALEETEWRWVEARAGQGQAFKERETSTVNTLESRSS